MSTRMVQNCKNLILEDTLVNLLQKDQTKKHVKNFFEKKSGLPLPLDQEVMYLILISYLLILIKLILIMNLICIYKHSYDKFN